VIVKNDLVVKRSEIVNEITSVLKEWHGHFKTFFLVSCCDNHIKQVQTTSYNCQQTNNPNLKKIREKMLELIKYRAQMVSGNLPVDEMKDIKLKATSEIDTGNKLLGKVNVGKIIVVDYIKIYLNGIFVSSSIVCGLILEGLFKI
jgi:dedicator of cytokinesis protein 1